MKINLKKREEKSFRNIEIGETFIEADEPIKDVYIRVIGAIARDEQFNAISLSTGKGRYFAGSRHFSVIECELNEI